MCAQRKRLVTESWWCCINNTDQSRLPDKEGCIYNRECIIFILGRVSLSYVEVKGFGLDYPEAFKNEGDLIEIFNFLQGRDWIVMQLKFPLVGKSRIEGHSVKIRFWLFRKDLKINSSTQWIMNLCNSLPRGGWGGSVSESNTLCLASKIRKTSNWVLKTEMCYILQDFFLFFYFFNL